MIDEDNKQPLSNNPLEEKRDMMKRVLLLALVLLVIIGIGARNSLPLGWRFWEKQVHVEPPALLKTSEIDRVATVNPDGEKSLEMNSPSLINANDNAALTKDDVKEIVKTYLQEKPEVIIEAIQSIQRRASQENAKSAQDFIAKNPDKLTEGKPYLGAKEASLTIIEFFDYRCGYCKTSHAALEKILNEYKNVRVVLQTTPMLGDKSVLAARASMSVWNFWPDSFAKFHRDLLNAPDISKQVIEDISARYNIPKAALFEKIDSDKVMHDINANMQLAQQLGVRAIPTFIINGEYTPSGLSYEDIKAKVDNALKQIQPIS